MVQQSPVVASLGHDLHSEVSRVARPGQLEILGREQVPFGGRVVHVGDRFSRRELPQQSDPRLVGGFLARNSQIFRSSHGFVFVVSIIPPIGFPFQ